MASRVTTSDGQALIELSSGLIMVVLIVSLSFQLTFILLKNFKHAYVGPTLAYQKIDIQSLEVKLRDNLVFLQDLSYQKKMSFLRKRGWVKGSEFLSSAIPISVFHRQDKELLLIDGLGVIE